MIFIIAFWVSFAIFLILILINSDFLEEYLQGLMTFFALLQIFFAFASIITNDYLIAKAGFNPQIEWGVLLILSALSIWRGFFRSIKMKNQDISTKLELIQDDTNTIKKIDENIRDIFETCKITRK
jgi:hypothetical protein